MGRTKIYKKEFKNKNQNLKCKEGYVAPLTLINVTPSIKNLSVIYQ